MVVTSMTAFSSFLPLKNLLSNIKFCQTWIVSAKVFHSQTHKHSSISEEPRGRKKNKPPTFFFSWTYEKIVVNFHLQSCSACVVGQILSHSLRGKGVNKFLGYQTAAHLQMLNRSKSLFSMDWWCCGHGQNAPKCFFVQQKSLMKVTRKHQTAESHFEEREILDLE